MPVVLVSRLQTLQSRVRRHCHGVTFSCELAGVENDIYQQFDIHVCQQQFVFVRSFGETVSVLVLPTLSLVLYVNIVCWVVTSVVDTLQSDLCDALPSASAPTHSTTGGPHELEFLDSSTATGCSTGARILSSMSLGLRGDVGLNSVFMGLLKLLEPRE